MFPPADSANNSADMFPRNDDFAMNYDLLKNNGDGIYFDEMIYWIKRKQYRW